MWLFLNLFLKYQLLLRDKAELYPFVFEIYFTGSSTNGFDWTLLSLSLTSSSSFFELLHLEVHQFNFQIIENGKFHLKFFGLKFAILEVCYPHPYKE